MRSRANSSRKLPLCVCGTKEQQEVRDAHLLDRLRMRQFAIEKLYSVYE